MTERRAWPPPLHRSLELHLEGAAHARHPLSRKCTVVSPTAKRHLRHVTPGAQTPLGWLFGCDVLPAETRPHLRLRHTTQHQLYQRSPEAAPPPPLSPAEPLPTGTDPATQEAQHASPHDVLPAHPAASARPVPEQPPAPADDGLQAPASPESLERWSWVHDVVRSKRGRQADVAVAAGLPLDYTLRSHGCLMTRPEVEVVSRAEATHRQALQTGDPHDWSWTGFTCWGLPTSQQQQQQEEEAGAAGRPGAAAALPLMDPDQAPTGKGAWVGALTHLASVAGDTVAAALLDRSVHLWRVCAGGRVHVHLVADHVNTPDVWPDMTVTIRAAQLDAPLLERLLELPMDVHEGSVTGELTILAYNDTTWCAALPTPHTLVPACCGTTPLKGGH